MSNILFHNKFHRTTHHTVSSVILPDSSSDSIASADKPFLGIFYNRLVDQNIIRYIASFNNDTLLTFDFAYLKAFLDQNLTLSTNTNSFEWQSAYATLCALSAGFGEYLTVFNTVTSLSSNWQAAYSFYVTLATNFNNLTSTQNTVNTVSSIWEEYPYKHVTNQAQQDTKAKNFAATVLSNDSSIVWVLSTNQAAVVALTGAVTFVNTTASNKKKGGKYQLLLRQPQSNNYLCSFGNDYVLSNTSSNTASARTLSAENAGITVVKFVSDGTKMYGKSEFYTLSGITPYTYFAGDGILLAPNPAEAYEGDAIQVGTGLIITGAVPFFSPSDGSINIV